MSKSKRAAGQYTQPEVRERIKAKVLAGDKGARPGQWSARKAQLLVHEYEKQGGGYNGPRSVSQKHLQKWAREKWQTKSGGERARHGKETERYLPEQAWKDLTPAQRRATNQKKRSESARGRQFISNTRAARNAGKAARKA